MEFCVLPVNSNVALYPEERIYLVMDNWNDWWEFRSLYQVFFKDERKEVTYIGSVKIGEFDMEDRPNLPDEVFGFLDENLFSLGQDKYYYENLNRLGDKFRDEYLKSMNDIALDPDLLNKVYNERVTTRSLMRDISLAQINNSFQKLALGESRLQKYHFKYTAVNIINNSITYDIEFTTKPNSNPPTNLYAIIGRNGVGKSQLLRNMASSLLGHSKNNPNIGTFEDLILGSEDNLFENIIYISFSAFDKNEIVKNQLKKKNKIGYSYIGLKKVRKSKKLGSTNVNEKIVTKSTEELREELCHSIWKCKSIPSKSVRLRNAIEMMSSDPIFSQSDISSLLNESELEKKIKDSKTKNSSLSSEEKSEIFDEFLDKANLICEKFSSGHSIVLLTIANLINELEESTVVLLDEPESHLHPPLLSTFTRILSNLLVKRNAIGIIATHSPVVIQEIPRKCVWIFNRYGPNLKFEKPEIETFGENINTLTREVFSYELTNSGFHKLLADAASEYDNYEEALESFNDELGMQAQAILKALINKENRGKR
ncbi:AAA family ATPase [Paenibacillus sp. NPDC058367]|uniref:AAA family ATPase n=1 Tax=Paenibacillus sp. NPDC058367 TaxID=3346460 RepID=UPI003655F2C7